MQILRKLSGSVETLHDPLLSAILYPRTTALLHYLGYFGDLALRIKFNQITNTEETQLCTEV